MVDAVYDVITCAKFHIEIFMGYDFTGGRIFDFPMSHTRYQQRFAIAEVAADWHEPMVPQRIMWPSIARANGQLDPRYS